MPAEGRENPLLKKGNSDAFFREKYLTKNSYGSADIGKPYLDRITFAARQYVADIFTTLRKYEYNPDLMRLYIVGGGGCLIRHFGQYDEKRVTIVDDICATAKGYESLTFSSLRRKG